MKVKDVMTPGPTTIDPDAPLATAVALMQEKEIRHLPVVDDTGRLTGIVSDRDLRSALVAPAMAEHLSLGALRRLRGLSETLENLRVRHAMTWDAVTIEPEAPVERAAAVMFEGHVSALPVVERGALVGIVTERDVLKALAGSLPGVRGADPDTFLW